MRPQVLVGARVDELGVDANPVARALDPAFEYDVGAKTGADLANVPDRVFILEHRCAGNHAQ